MTQYYRAGHEGTEVLISIEQADQSESPLEWTDPVKDHRPLFVLTNHRHYKLGDEDAEDIAWSLLRQEPKWRAIWEEQELFGLTRHGAPVKDTDWGCFRSSLGWVVNVIPEDAMYNNVEPGVPFGDGYVFTYEDTNPDELPEGLEGIVEAARRVDAYCVPVYMYDHSGVSISLRHVYPYNDRWDSGVLGFILWTRKQMNEYALGASRSCRRAIAMTPETIEAEVDVYFQDLKKYVEGDVWEVLVVDPARPLSMIGREWKEMTNKDFETCMYYGKLYASCGELYGYNYVAEWLKESGYIEVEELPCR